MSYAGAPIVPQPAPAEQPASPEADLLAAVVDALDVPLPSLDPADGHAHQQLLAHRARDVRIVAASVLEGASVVGATADLRRWTAETPVTYTPWRPPAVTRTPAGPAVTA